MKFLPLTLTRGKLILLNPHAIAMIESDNEHSDGAVITLGEQFETRLRVQESVETIASILRNAGDD